MTKSYLGLDPGEKGCATLITEDGVEHWFFAEYSLPDLASILLDIRSKHPHIHAVLEDVKNVYGVGAMSTFKLGENKGKLLGLLCATCIPYTLVPPQRWQRAIFTSSDMVYDQITPKKKLNTKKTSANAAHRIFPSVDFRRTERCKNIDDNFTDSALLAEYGRRLNL